MEAVSQGPVILSSIFLHRGSFWEPREADKVEVCSEIKLSIVTPAQSSVSTGVLAGTFECAPMLTGNEAHSRLTILQ